MNRSAFLGLLISAGLCVGACTGNIGDGVEGGNGEVQGTLCAVDTPIRRMTRIEYNNTVRDLLGDTTQPGMALPPEISVHGFDNQAEALQASQLLAEQYMKVAEEISERATADLPALLPGCAASDGDSCAIAFIEDFAKRAYRRVPTQEEVDKLEGLFDFAMNDPDMGTFEIGVQLVIQAVLQSPHFLYRPEFGNADPIELDVLQLNDWELASKLSYMLWNTMPDQELFDAAEAGQIRTSVQIEAQARRMLDDPKAKDAIRNFHEQWLLLGHLETVSKDGTVYPNYDDSLRPLWREEMGRFVEHVILEDDGKVSTLLSAPYSFMDAQLAAFYGADVTGSAPGGATMEQVQLDPTRRAGLLTQGALMATLAGDNQSSPVHRGKFIREQIMCQLIQPPPNDLVIVPPDLDSSKTTREQFEEIGANPDCSGCHSLMNPIGFGFENYDAIGQWRDTQNGKPIDATGEIIGGGALAGTFDGAVELAQRLGNSPQVAQCVQHQWFRFAYNRDITADDTCSTNEIRDKFMASEYNIKELLVALTLTDAFIYRHRVDPDAVPEEGGAQ